MSYNVAGIFPNSQCSDWHHDPTSKEKELMRCLLQPGLLQSHPNTRCREPLIFCKRKLFTAYNHQIHCCNKPKEKNKIIPMKETKQSNKLKQIRTRGCDECDPKHVSFQLHILSFSSDSCSQLVLLKTVKRFYLKNTKPWKNHQVSFFVSFICMPLKALKDYNQNLIVISIQFKLKCHLKMFTLALLVLLRRKGNNRYPASIFVPEIYIIHFFWLAKLIWHEQILKHLKIWEYILLLIYYLKLVKQFL